MLRKYLYNKIFLVGLLLYMFILFEISQFILLSRLILVISPFYYFIYQFLFILLFIILLYIVLNSRYIRFILSLILTIAFGAVLIFTTLFAFFRFPWLKLHFGILFALSCAALYNSLLKISLKKLTLPPLSWNAKKALIIIGIFLAGILFLPVIPITISPKGTPEVYFWTSTGALPDNNTLDYCADNDIGFVVVLREHYIVDEDDPTEGDDESFDLTRAADRGVNLYIALGGPSGEFFATVNNAEIFPELYDTIRNWLKESSLFGSVKGFVLDEEPPIDFVEDMNSYDYAQKVSYFLNSIPTEERIDEVKDEIGGLISDVHDDGKEIGIVKMPSITDEIDGDNDYSRFVRTFYNIPFDWDFSVSMIYRTQHIPDLFDYLIEDMSNYDYTNDHEIEYLNEDDVERYLMPTSSYYYKTAYEYYNTEVYVPQDSRYIFSGTFYSKFRHTTYIEEKGYLDDIDICRHFGMDKVFLFYYSGFIARYSEDELENLVDHLNQEESWNLVLPSYIIQRELLISLSYATIDRFIIL